ncbi:interleukin-25 [Emydura macquarii macquarii]|uniref:interleukin-25 n=1 Tax=Emydura macquarii macquarii TaxID=1129001 RepID=UPI003529DE9C
MAETPLAVLSLSLCLLLQARAASLGGSRGCLGDSECCTPRELERAQARLGKGSPPGPQHCPSSPQPPHRDPHCQGQAHGPPNSRSVAPWRYREDCDSTRFPRLLLQAECLCPHCVSLEPPHGRDRRGNSVRIDANTTVYYRRPCPGRPDAFYLEPQLYPVAVACVCVLPRS